MHSMNRQGSKMAQVIMLFKLKLCREEVLLGRSEVLVPDL